MEHTKEPWRTDVDSGFPGDVMAGKEIIARTTITERSNAEANARRIAACVNACAGIPNNFLEGQNLDAKFVFMQERINAIEQQRDELQLERDNYKSVAEAHSGAFQECIRLREQRDELLAALKRLWLSCPAGLECNSFHHAKRDQHDFNQECGPAAEYLAAIEQANATIAKVQK